MFRIAAAALAALGILTIGASAQETPSPEQIPISAFTQNTGMWGVSLSPDGQSVALIRRTELGEALYIVDWQNGRADAIQVARRDMGLHIGWVAWKNNERLVFGASQFGITRVLAVDRDGSGLRQMFEGQAYRLAASFVPMQLIDRLAGDPDHVLLGTYGQRGFTVYRADINTGRVQAVDDADWDTVDMFVDGQGNPVMRVDALPNGSGWQIFRRPSSGGRWQIAHEVRQSTIAENRAFFPLGAGPGAGQIYVAARPEGQEFQAIYLYDTNTGLLGEPAFQHEHADAAVAWLDPNTHAVIVGCGETQRWECRALRPEMQRHFDALNRYFEGDADIALTGVSENENFWLLYAEGPTLPGTYYVYNLTTHVITPVGTTQPQVPAERLAATRIVNYAGRDGTPLWGYLTEPRGGGVHPLVVVPHGGPETRDSFGYEAFTQFLASRGYAVFQPNFRGSAGSGRSFARAGYRQWGRTMQDDITDGVNALIASGDVDRSKICIVGGSYGGYAALVGATLTPDLYKCVISIAGVADLGAFMDSERRDAGRRSTTYAYWLQLIGDPSADEAVLRSVSPASHAEHATAPILLIHGTRDSVVPFHQSEIMRDALQASGMQTRLVSIEGEGHIWSRWTEEHRTQLLQETETFLAEHIGPATPAH